MTQRLPELPTRLRAIHLAERARTPSPARRRSIASARLSPAHNAPARESMIGPCRVMTTRSMTGLAPRTRISSATICACCHPSSNSYSSRPDSLCLEMFDIGILHIGEGRREAPRDVTIVTRDDARRARQRYRRSHSAHQRDRKASTRWFSYQMDGVNIGRCMSPARSGAPVAERSTGDGPVVAAHAFTGSRPGEEPCAGGQGLCRLAHPVVGNDARGDDRREARRRGRLQLRGAFRRPGSSIRRARSTSLSQLIERVQDIILAQTRLSAGVHGSG